MKCPNCNITNNEGAKFCRACGAELKPQPANVMDKFPGYNFVPTNLIDWKKPRFAKIRTIILYVLIIVCVLFLAYSIMVVTNVSVNGTENEDKTYSAYAESPNDFLDLFYGCSFWNDYEKESYAIDAAYYDFILQVRPWIFICAILTIILSFGIRFSKRKYPAKDNLLKNSADYIQQYSYSGFIKGRKKPVLKFFVRNNKMGLMDVAHYCVFLPAQYDMLEWREKNKYLNATVGNQTFIIDIKGTKLK